MKATSNLESMITRIDAGLARKNEFRDQALQRSRSLIRFCANSIRATHRHEQDTALDLLSKAREAATTMVNDARTYPDLYYAGYVQDALKELTEAEVLFAVVDQRPLPDPDEMGIEYAAYLNGLGEAAGELRRYALDAVRRDDLVEAERALEAMDDIYTYLVTIDYPDSLTGGLRRTTDMVRGVTERTRGDLTTAVRQEKLQLALQAFEGKLKEQSGK